MKEETLRKLMLACACMLAATALAGCGSDDSSSASSTDATTEETTTTADNDDDRSGEADSRQHRRRQRCSEGWDRAADRAKGDRVVLVVKSDVADEIHLHGYDKSTDVTAGGTARLPFTATIPGRFEVELESRGVQIADLTVNP